MKKSTASRQFIIRAIGDGSSTVTKKVMDRFGVSRPTALRWMQALIDEGIVKASGNTRAREYRLGELFSVSFIHPLSRSAAEDQIWRANIEPHLVGYEREALNIAHYVFTEMVNNVIDHSGADEVFVLGRGNASELKFQIVDEGIGIFRKIMEHHELEDERHAVLELSKGKLTTDQENHTGEGIFFSSRACRAFEIDSGTTKFKRVEPRNDWLIDLTNRRDGTAVFFVVDAIAPLPLQQVFDRYTAKEEFGFEKTHVPVHLARYQGQGLVSRSQAKRLLARVEKFKEVHLDFQGIDEIGQAFADEIFRVFANAHPEVKIYITRDIAPAVRKMIDRTGTTFTEWEDRADE